jgi:polysaccharide biosynthesis protein PslG
MTTCLGAIALIATLCAADRSATEKPVLVNAEALRIGLAFGGTLTSMPPSRLAATLDDAVALGAKWIRADLSWDEIQPDSPTAYRWERFDRVAVAARERGLTLLPIITYTPAWARPRGCNSDKCAPADPERFAKFAGEAAGRYRGIATWEIWNEENSELFWEPTPDAIAYGKLLEAATTSIHKSNPSAQVIVGGLANTGGIPPREYLVDLVATGATRGADGLAVHPYTYPDLASANGPWDGPGGNSVTNPQSLRSVFAEAGVPELPLWITEFGAPTGGRDEGDHVSEARQAEIVEDGVQTAASDDGIASFIWYSYQDTGSDPDDPESHYGLVRADGSKKPAYEAFRRAVAGPYR